MPENKKQHFVPQFYLRNFGDGNSIPVLNLPKKKYVPITSIADQCQGDYLYTHDVAIEKSIGKIEDESAEVISEVIKTNNPPEQWSEQHRQLMAFLILQKERTPSAGKGPRKGLKNYFKCISRCILRPLNLILRK